LRDTLTLLEHGIGFRRGLVDIADEEVVSKLFTLLGPEIQCTVAGVKGSGRTAHWLSSGIVVVTQSRDTELVTLFVCFDERDSSPYPQVLEVVPSFHGAVVVDDTAIQGGEPESQVLKDPKVQGFGGMYHRDLGDLHVGIHCRKPINKLGRRSGQRRVVRVAAEWGCIKGFPRPHES
jgi:hypothetical protein